MGDRWLSTREAAEYLGMHIETVRDKARLGQVPGYKVGRGWRFKASILDEWVTAGCPTQAEQPSLFDERPQEAGM